MTAFRNVVGAVFATLISNPVNAQDLQFALINMSGYTLVEFYASPENVRSWEEDILGDDVLESGYALNITVADGRTQCVYDLLMLFDDGDRLEDTVDLCEMGSYTIE